MHFELLGGMVEKVLSNVRPDWLSVVGIYTTIEPRVGIGKAKIGSRVTVELGRTLSVWKFGSVDVGAGCDVAWSATLDLEAIESGGRLLVGVDVSERRADCTFAHRIITVFGDIPWAEG